MLCLGDIQSRDFYNHSLTTFLLSDKYKFKQFHKKRFHNSKLRINHCDKHNQTHADHKRIFNYSYGAAIAYHIFDENFHKYTSPCNLSNGFSGNLKTFAT
jgi:hypothetical protein